MVVVHRPIFLVVGDVGFQLARKNREGKQRVVVSQLAKGACKLDTNKEKKQYCG